MGVCALAALDCVATRCARDDFIRATDYRVGTGLSPR